MAGFVIAIDGPVASGKGTIAPLLAQELSGEYLDTGVFYRCVSLYCIEQHISFETPEEIISTLPQITVQFLKGKVLLNGKDVSQRIRDVDVSNGSSKVAAID